MELTRLMNIKVSLDVLRASVGWVQGLDHMFTRSVCVCVCLHDCVAVILSIQAAAP